HVRLDEGVDDAAEEDLHAEQREQLGLRPAVEPGRVRVDEREHDEPGADLDQRLEELDEEVDAVLQLVEDADLEEQPADAKGVHPPTAEKRLTAARQASVTSAKPPTVQSTCAPSPKSSDSVERSPARDSI